MKKSWLILAICLVGLNSGYAQEDEFLTEVRSLFWGAKDKHSNDVEVPEKWKNESAVILYQKILYKFIRLGAYKFIEGEGIRRRIKLQDQSAIDEYSEFTINNPFQSKMSKSRKWESSIAELKIIKANGEVKEVDMSKGVSIDGGINKQKIAIPGLVPGDILDFFYYSVDKKKILSKHTVESSSPVISTLAASYPIVEQLLQFEVDEKYFFSGNSYNGAPSFKFKIGEDGQRIYYLIDKDREKEDDIRWYYERIESPSIKYQATILPNEKRSENVYNFLGKPGEQHKGLTEAEYFERVKDYKNFNSISLLDKIERKKSKELNQIDFLEYLYQKRRYEKVGQYLEPITLTQNDIYSEIYIPFEGFPSSWGTASNIGGVLRALDIPFELLIAAPRNVSTFDNILLEEEVEYMIRAKVDGKYYYIPTWYTFNEFNRIPDYLEGAEALSIHVSDRGVMSSGKKITLPISSYEKNNTLRSLKIDLSDLSAAGLKAERSTEVIGLSKEYYQNNLITLQDHNTPERVLFGKGPFLSRYMQSLKAIKVAQNRYTEYCEKQKEKQFETAKIILDDEVRYEISKFESLDIISVGRLEDKTLSFDESYLIDPSFIKRAGKNYLVPIGQLIDDQVAIQEEDKIRSKNIYMPFSRSFSYDIEVMLPDGYVVEGLEKLNKSVKNSTGGFESKVVLEENILRITSKKWYEHNYEKADKWPEMVDFLDAAFQFTQEKVLLKKAD